jgi:predicted outer membrane repeat protein
MLRPALYTAAVLCVPAGACGAIINVGPGQSIQSAINIASSGDTIVVAPGTYHEAIDFVGKAITVRSSGGPAVTTIDASAIQASAVTFASGEPASTVLEGFTVTGGVGTPFGSERNGGAVYCWDADPVIRNCAFEGNTANQGGAVYTWFTSAQFVDCTFDSNTSVEGEGGGAIYNGGGYLRIWHCKFINNSADANGGAIQTSSTNPVWIVNCEFRGNSAMFGGAMKATEGWTIVTNCTFEGNTATVVGGAVLENSSGGTISNSIFWDNVPDQIWQSTTSAAEVHYCNVMGGWSGPGSNNMNQVPMFANPAAGDLHLLPGSPCINEGDDSELPADVDTDLDGLPRFVGPVDLGPYEVQGGGDPCPADIDDDGLVGVNDFLDLLASWGAAGGPADIDGDGVVGVTDFLDLLAYWGPCP